MKFIIMLAFVQALASNAVNIDYESIPLEWNQFKKVQKIDNGAAAQIAIQSQYQIEQKNNILHFSSSITVDPNLSKVNKNILEENNTYNNSKLLEHEKGHLVISLIHHYKLVDSIKNTELQKLTYKTTLRNIIKHFDNQKNEMNYRYDKVTNHHINHDKQVEWDKNILEQLSRYVNNNQEIQWTLKISKKLS